ncbi:DUF559 domain-containing protein [Micromonospora sp. STR1_7]|uniref:DUF559 domain-containing protein n=2 Tax=Micromonospora parastrephiae TaxID=2806101 RepID=A0ABS1XS98_9ACTN|nr:DUF559 domain-containing protein [Micromonospora parastrephiae]
MPPRPHRPDALTWQVFRGSDAVRDGLLSEHQLRSAAWVRLRHDIYADARLERDHALACRATLLRLPPGVVVGGPSAAYLHGIEHAATFTDDVHVVVPRQLRVGAQRGLRVHVNAFTPPFDIGPRQPAEFPSGASRPTSTARPPSASHPPSTPRRSTARPPITARLAGQLPNVGTSPRPAGPPPRQDAVVAEPGSTVAPGHGLMPAPTLTPVCGPGGPIPRSDPGRAAWETAVWLDPVRAVTIVDSLLGQGLTDRAALTGIAARNANRPGGRRAQWLFDLTDAGAQSPPESQLRVRLVLGGLPRPSVQHPVRLPNGVVLHPDLAWPEYRVAVEYDGQWHADADQLHRDRRRLNLLVSAGWLVLHVTSRRLHAEFPAVLREVRAALVARGWRR